MLKYTEFIMILYLLEILFLNLCLFLSVNVYVKIYNSYRCICWLLGPVLGQRMCRRKFGLIAVVFIFIWINPLNAS
jgi:hypothetical protein